MKIQQILVSLLAATFLLSGSFPVFAAETDKMPEDTITEQENARECDEAITDNVSLSEMTVVSGEETDSAEEDEPLSEKTEDVLEENSLPETAWETEDETDFPVPDEAPAFHARIEHRMGYTVTGTFTDFTPDIIKICTLYSLDGENWQAGMVDWNLRNLDTNDEEQLKGLQNQPCLYNAHEPLKSYLAGEIDCFYLKLLITKRNGLSYETQSAAIERSGLQPIPEGTECRARFSSAIAVREPDPTAPYRHLTYGRYQLTVSADATAEDVSALLPDTLPVEVQLEHGADFFAIGVVDCPVTWKPLYLPRLSPGESIIIPDAAEEILVPSGTLVSTPLGAFSLDEPLYLNTPPATDEVRLVLNVSEEDSNPTGVLREGNNGLEMAFHHKPTGAVSIRAYVLAEGESKWTELSGLSLLKDLNQPSTANSGYAIVLRNDQEPYRSYLAAEDAGETPAPFFISLNIEGGLYDGRQLILAWPDIYEQLPDLPGIRGAEGNEGNAGADNKEDSTESGQRPNLPQLPDDSQKEQPQNPAPDNNYGDQPQNPAPDNNHGDQPQDPASDNNHGDQPQDPASDNNHGDQPQNPAPDNNHEDQPQDQTPDNNQKDQPQDPASDNNHGDQPQNPAPNNKHEDQSQDLVPNDNHGDQPQFSMPDDNEQKQQTLPPHTLETASAIFGNQSTPSTVESVSDHQPDRQENQSMSGQRPNLPHATPDTSDTSAANQEDSLKSASLLVHAAEDVIAEESVLALSGVKTTIEHTAENGSLILLLPVITTVAAGGCISMVVCKATGYRPFQRIVRKIRTILRT